MQVKLNPNRQCLHSTYAVLPRGRNFGLKTQKGPKKLCGAGKNRVKFLCRFIRKGPKWVELFVVWFCTKTLLFSTEIGYFLMLNSTFLYHFALWIIENTSNVSLYENILWGAEFFRQRPKFLVDLAEKFCQELATLHSCMVGIGNENVNNKCVQSWISF
jgi:hypothetical protein